MTASDHGSASTYRNWDCRCTRCRAAHTAYQLRARQRRAQRLITGEATPPHGIESTYLNYKCRCDECTAEHTRRQTARDRARRART